MSKAKNKRETNQLELQEEVTIPARIWRDADGKRYGDAGDVILTTWLEEQHKKALDNKEEPIQLIVGTDSQLHGYNFKFITVVCAYRPGKGGNFLYTIKNELKTHYKGNQQARMFEEATKSIEISNLIVESTMLKPVVHLDMSPKKAGKFTSAFSDQVKGYVAGFGYNCRIKPVGFVASCVADHISKK